MSSISQSKVIATECPICMESIEGPYNRVVTECGHAFHCSCLMQNAAHNGFNCPYCRTKMAEEQKEEDDDDDDFSMSTVFEEDTLTTFRMFHQQLNGEEVEEEIEDEWENVEEQELMEQSPRPNSTYVAQKLAERGISFEDLVMNTLCQEHSNLIYYSEYDQRSNQVYGQFKAIIAQYIPHSPREDLDVEEDVEDGEVVEVVDGQHRALVVANMLDQDVVV